MSTDPELRLSFEGVSSVTLRTLAARLRGGQLAPPFNAFNLSGHGGCPASLAADLQRLAEDGLAPRHLALILDTAAQAVEVELKQASAVQLVWTGPEIAVSHSRDTAVVVDELFSQARESVLVSTFAIQQGRRVFAALASRMQVIPSLRVRLFVHVSRSWNDTREESTVLREFAEDLKEQWPGTTRPAVFYDPRTLSADAATRASWHAKCVLVDDEVSFVTSANFTEWAQQRNVEAGVLVRNPHFTRQLRAQFDAIVHAGLVRRLPGW
jgi:phosphatidylserine/phosphatidylglycerophosphate/cardiolipin synthase-like enzyme